MSPEAIFDSTLTAKAMRGAGFDMPDSKFDQLLVKMGLMSPAYAAEERMSVATTASRGSAVFASVKARGEVGTGRVVAMSAYDEAKLTSPTPIGRLTQKTMLNPNLPLSLAWWAGKSGKQQERETVEMAQYVFALQEARQPIVLGRMPETRTALPRYVEIPEAIVPGPATAYRWKYMTPEEKKSSVISNIARGAVMGMGIWSGVAASKLESPVVSYGRVSKLGLPEAGKTKISAAIGEDTQATRQVFATSRPLTATKIYGESGLGESVVNPAKLGYKSVSTPVGRQFYQWQAPKVVSGRMIIEPYGSMRVSSSLEMAGGSKISSGLIGKMKIPIEPEWSPYGLAGGGKLPTVLTPIASGGVSVSRPSTATMTKANVARLSGVSPVVWAVSGTTLIGGIAKGSLPVSPGLPTVSPIVPSPLVSPVIVPSPLPSIVLSPMMPTVIAPRGIPSPIVGGTPSPLPTPLPIPTPIPPYPTPIVPTPVPSSPIVTPRPTPTKPSPVKPILPIPGLPSLGGGAMAATVSYQPTNLGQWNFGYAFAGTDPISGKVRKIRFKRSIRYGNVPTKVLRSRISGQVNSDSPYYKREYIA